MEAATRLLEQIADAIVFLLSDHASAITGALIPIAGRV
jgi:enoyl-[acyl-carrier-protein] reductase (NADH)